MVEKCCYNIFFMECFSGKEDVDKRRQENNKTLLIVCVCVLFKTVFYGHIFNILNTFTFGCRVIPLWSTFGLHLVMEGPKAFVNLLF